jgi:quercetin dioxygenase-like cupin family protein
MAVVFNEHDVAAEPFGSGATRQRLITAAGIPGSSVLLDRWTLAPGAEVQVHVPSTSVAWFHLLEGVAAFAWPAGTDRLDEAHAVFLASGSQARLASSDGATVLYVEVPHAERYGVEDGSASPTSRVIDWKREPLLDSKHDSRKRIYMATPKLFGTRAMKCEMIIYPPRTSGSKHLHEGAEHFKYVLAGSGTGFADDEPHSLKKGDVVYHPAGEWHYSLTGADENVRFIEFFVPGVFKTVWASERICSWLPSGKSMDGSTPVREIAAHAGNEGTPSDV